MSQSTARSIKFLFFAIFFGFVVAAFALHVQVQSLGEAESAEDYAYFSRTSMDMIVMGNIVIESKMSIQ